MAGTRMARSERPNEEMDDGRTDGAIGIGDTVIQFTIWPSIYLPDIISSIARYARYALSPGGKWDFLPKTHRRRFKVKANQRRKRRWH